MKKLLIALICLAVVGPVQAQKSKQKVSGPAPSAVVAEEKAEDVKGPKFKFKGGETHDFGNLKEGPVAEYTFEFTNVGKEPLIIQNANASCGCTTPEWPKEPILPGKTGKIVVRYNTQGRPGPFSKDVFITSNAISEKERYELHIKGTVEKAEEAKQ